MDMSEGGKKEPLTSPAPAQSALGPSRSLQGLTRSVTSFRWLRFWLTYHDVSLKRREDHHERVRRVIMRGEIWRKRREKREVSS
jgi:hypothetical protein